MRVVLDTNVLVSGLLKRDGIPGRLLQAVWNGSLELVRSEGVLPRDWPPSPVAQFVTLTPLPQAFSERAAQNAQYP